MLLVLALSFIWISPASALFTNGGFETGDFTGWNLEFGKRNANVSTITWGQPDHGLYDVIDSAATMVGQTLDVDPYYDNYMARINDIKGRYHATKLWQQDTIAAEDQGDTIYVTWGAMLIEPSNAHPDYAQPYFGINVYQNGSLLDSFFADALDTTGWTNAGSYGGTLWYNTDTWSYDLSGFNVGDSIKIEMFVSDCAWGGHGGYAFLDGIGKVPPPPVPEPATILLLSAGLAGIVAFRRKKRETLD